MALVQDSTTILAEVEVSMEGGDRLLEMLRPGDKVSFVRALTAGGGAPTVRVERAAGGTIGRLDDMTALAIRPFLESSPGGIFGTLVSITVGEEENSPPRVVIDLEADSKAPDAVPAPTPEQATDELIPTKDYPYPYPFPLFNPVQSEVFRHREEDVNLIVSADTSAGKTIASELVADVVLAGGRKVIYLSPFKALTEERHADWKERYAGRRLVVTTGDYELTPELQQALRLADIVLMTSEMMDSRTRKFESERNEWLREVGLVIVDEAHILSTPRGDKVETGLMRFTRRCPDARLVLLSATISNYEEIGGWLTSLNGKETVTVHKRWRPVRLAMHIEEHPVFRRGRGEVDYRRTEASKLGRVIEWVLSKPGEKFLIFVHAKNSGLQILSRLKRQGVSAAFHHGDLDLPERLAVERAFKDRQNGIRALVSTSTTAWGVNLPARNVVIAGTTRGLHPVDEIDIIQMAGRAGRYGIDTEGHVYLLVPSGTRDRWEKAFRKPRPVCSVLNDRRCLLSHVLAEIYTGAVRNVDDIYAWYRRSLAHRQGLKPFSLEEVDYVLNRLIDLLMIQRVDGRLEILPLGEVASVMYFHPEDIHAWKRNFDLFFNRLEGYDEAALAWALGNVPCLRADYLAQEWNLPADQLKARLDRLDLDFDRLCTPAISSFRAMLTEDPSDTTSRPSLLRLALDSARIVQTLRMIDRRAAAWRREQLWEDLAARFASFRGRHRQKKRSKPDRSGPKSPALKIYRKKTGELLLFELPPPQGRPVGLLNPVWLNETSPFPERQFESGPADPLEPVGHINLGFPSTR